MIVTERVSEPPHQIEAYGTSEPVKGFRIVEVSVKYLSVLFTFLLLGCVGDPPPTPTEVFVACAVESTGAPLSQMYPARKACEARMGYPEHPRPRWAIPFNTNNWGISPLMY